MVQPSSLMNVKINVIPQRLIAYDARGGYMKIAIVHEMEWNDKRLTWLNVSYDGLDHIIIPAARIWLPDIVLLNRLLKLQFCSDFRSNLE